MCRSDDVCEFVDLLTVHGCVGRYSGWCCLVLVLLLGRPKCVILCLGWCLHGNFSGYGLSMRRAFVSRTVAGYALWPASLGGSLASPKGSKEGL